MSAVIFSGPKTKALKPGIQLGNFAAIYSGILNPSTDGFVANLGDQYLSTTTNLTYQKTGAGDTAWSVVLNNNSTINATQVADGSVSNAEFQYLDGVTSNIQTQINSKQATGNYITGLTGDGTASGPGSAGFTLATVNTAGTYTKLVTNVKGLVTSGGSLINSDLPTGIDSIKIADGSVSNAEFQYLDGVTSNIQTQLNAKASTVTGDIQPTAFIASNNIAVFTNITGFAFNNATIRSFSGLISITRAATFEQVTLSGIQIGASWNCSMLRMGDETGVLFNVDSSGQVQYTSTSTGSTAALSFRATVTYV